MAFVYQLWSVVCVEEEEWGSEVAGKAEEGSHRAVEGYRSKVDDEFFKLHDMEMFLEQAEQLSSAGESGR